MRKVIFLGMILMLASIVVACGGSANAKSTAGDSAGGSARLSEDYADALPVAEQLIAGSLRLEDSDLAIDETQAGELLPLWQAYRSLSNSDTAAAAEITALLNQVQATMSPAQIAAIAAMKLTADDLTSVMQDRGAALGFGGASANNGTEGNNAGGGFRGGFPGGGFPGGGPGGGFEGGGPGGNFGGGFGGQQSAEARATAVAARSSDQAGDFASTFATRGLLSALITSLQVKAGEIDQADIQAAQAARGRLRWLPVISEASGIPVETLQEAVTGGTTLADAITVQGGDLAAVEAALKETLSNNPDLSDQDIEQQIDNVLNGTPSTN